MRRVIDVSLAIFCLTLFAPLILLIALLIKLDSPGPVLYVPQMVGQHGRVFSLFRFRTMSVKVGSLNAEQRLTRIGRLIRNYSLDHLPMLFNLLLGDLTIIGPRSMEVEVVNNENKVWQEYFTVKPGLISYAVLQLGKSWTPTRTTHPNLNQELELEYLHIRSASFDLRLILKTILGLVMSRGNIKARGAANPDVERQLNDRSQ